MDEKPATNQVLNGFVVSVNEKDTFQNHKEALSDVYSLPLSGWNISQTLSPCNCLQRLQVMQQQQQI